jgi:flagellar basal-body rod protein FlgB
VQDAPILGLLRDTLGYLTQRQRVLADNVANANTPGYVPKDISESAFERALRDRSPRDATPVMTITSARHLAAPGARPGLAIRADATPDSEMTINGNAVVLEEQMTKVIDTQMRYQTVVGLYEKSLGLLRMAARPPGR